MASAGTQVQQNSSDERKDFFSSSTALIILNLLLIVSTIAVYAPVRHHPFVNYDDPWYVAENSYIRSGLTATTLHWALLSRTYCHNWHPVTWISHALDIQIFGLNAGAHHEMNVLLHALNAVLLFWVLRRATGSTGPSFVVAALFALHPINVESVAWISERKNVLSMTFFTLTLAAYRYYARKPTDSRYALVALLYVLGLMTKAQVIALPLLLLLWDYWPLRRISSFEEVAAAESEPFPRLPLKKLIGEKIPLLVVGAGAALITMSAQEVSSAQNWQYSLGIRLENAIVSYAKYLGKAFWPARLAPFYPHPGNSLTVLQVSSALLLLLVISGLVFAGRRHRYLVVGWLWFLISLLPMIGLIQVWEQGMADRYAYHSFIGLFIMVCWGYVECAERFGLPRMVTAAVAVAVLVSLAVVARYQTRYWSNSVAVWTRSLEVTPSNNFVAEQSLAGVLTTQGRDAEAMPYLLRSLELRPDDPLSNLLLAGQERKQGDLKDAIEHYKRALNAPDSVVAQKRYALTRLAQVYAEMGDSSQAQQFWEQSKQLPADDVIMSPEKVY